MRLKKLELSGFKSFAKPTTLEFPVSISAIVGPNGSGKSNVAEAIRWAMGEQSMKSLRGKRGEDLIFNGSPSEPRLGKAGVSLLFDNADGAIPLDFPEVKLERRIFRDGTNEYLLNDSVVRLKDIVELIARIGLGENKHNIIGQGEVDRWLFASPKDRKEILEEALGLKVYQIKKVEAGRKLESTRENMVQAEALLKEITPHLKFLKHQAEKAKTKDTLEAELKHLERIYFARVSLDIVREEALVSAYAFPHEKELGAAEADVLRIKQRIASLEASPIPEHDIKKLEEHIDALDAKRRELERESGRVEGRIAVEREKLAKPLIRIADAAYVKEKIAALLETLRAGVSSDAFETRLQETIQRLESLMKDIEKGSVEIPPDEGSRRAFNELIRAHEGIAEELKKIADTLDQSKASLREKDLSSKTREADLRKLERELREVEEKRAAIRSKLERATYERQTLSVRRSELEKEMGLTGIGDADLHGISDTELDGHQNSQDLFKKIERLRGKLEEVGGIDVSVIKEYQDTESRHAFLTKELEDLREADTSLKELVKTLEKQIAEDFERGFKKINQEFNNYFALIFGGGKAKLLYRELRIKNQESSDEMVESEDEKAEYGIDIDVDIPRKRIKSLSMLSGGERALTSIALLFALVSVNPPPFLVLDETDAALDEANSQKYANTLVELSKKTQLIIITHNRETMMRSGILYGVTMGERGISKIISIKFEEGEKYVNR